MKDYVCAIDIGTTLTRVLVARSPGEDVIEILGVGVAPTKGVRGGVIVNIDQAIQSLTEATREAELISGLVVDEALVGISGRHLRGDNSRGVVAITNKDRMVRESDVLRVIEGARNIKLPVEYELLHVLSREFMVDDQRDIHEPIGMTGVRLEAEVHVVSAHSTALSNLERVAEGAGISVANIVMNSLAAAEAVLSPGEKDMGVAVLDIGGGVTDFIVYQEGGVYFSGSLPLGGNHISQDLSYGLRIPLEAAEHVKKTYGIAKISMTDPTETFEVTGASGRPSRKILRQDASAIIEARLKEIFEMVDEELAKSGRRQNLSGGLILVGGGSLIEGTDSLAEDVFGLNVSHAVPSGLSGFTERAGGAEFSTVIGLIRYAGRIAVVSKSSGRPGTRSGSRVDENGLFVRLKGWINENF